MIIRAKINEDGKVGLVKCVAIRSEQVTREIGKEFEKIQKKMKKHKKNVVGAVEIGITEETYDVITIHHCESPVLTSENLHIIAVNFGIEKPETMDEAIEMIKDGEYINSSAFPFEVLTFNEITDDMEDEFWNKVRICIRKEDLGDDEMIVDKTDDMVVISTKNMMKRYGGK